VAYSFGIERNGGLSAMPTPLQLFLLSEGSTVAMGIALAAELGIADLLVEGPRSSAELAGATSTHPAALYRLLRLLTSFGVFSETEPDRFAQSPLSELLRTGTPGSLRAWLRMTGLSVWWRSLADSLETMKTNESAFRRVIGSEAFDYLATHPRDGEIVNEAMSALGQAAAAAVPFAYDFRSLRKIVDVGGGHGTLMSAILRFHRHLTGIVFDLPHVVENARTALTNAGVADRCEIAAGDFFESVPPGGDAYILSSIVHDWERDRAIAILRNCRQAMTPDGRVLLIELVIPGPNEPHVGKIMDFVMLVLLGGQERTEQEYADLLGEAGYRLNRVIPTLSPMSIVEAMPI
jgi:SAM-dependent methyltransferase